MSNRLEGKVALVTACTRGIGRAIADLFVDEGAKVYYACRYMETGKAAVEAARARGGQAELVYFEAHDPATHRSMIDECIAKEGRLDVLVNNFGESNPRKDLDITKCTYKEFEKTVLLHISDDNWKENLRQLDELRHSVQNASYEQKDPLLIFKLESAKLFDAMVNDMNNRIASILTRAQIPEMKRQEENA